MAKMIQVRDVPDDIHRTLKARAALHGMNLSDYLKLIFRDSVAQPTFEEWLNTVATRKIIPKKQTSAQLIREMRDSR